MRHILFVLFALFVVLSLTSVAGQKSEKKGKETTITGEVVDVSCYLAHGSKGMGEGHSSCAEACAKAGGPLGIVTKNGKLYVSVLPDDHLAGPNAKLVDHVSHNVEATGILRSQGGVNGIMITKVEMTKSTEKK